jgi:hypothetical protein
MLYDLQQRLLLGSAGLFYSATRQSKKAEDGW